MHFYIIYRLIESKCFQQMHIFTFFLLLYLFVCGRSINLVPQNLYLLTITLFKTFTGVSLITEAILQTTMEAILMVILMNNQIHTLDDLLLVCLKQNTKLFIKLNIKDQPCCEITTFQIVVSKGQY